jgi:hypothetical protein
LLQESLDETMKAMVEYMSDKEKEDYENNKMS